MNENKNLKLLIIAFIILLVIIIISIVLLSNNIIKNKEEYINYNEITASTITNTKNKNDFYGKIVTNYNCENNEGVNAWKIFYADENNIYLITDDCISYDYCPSSATQKIKKITDYNLSMHNILNDYNGSSDIVDKKIRALNNSYFTKNNYESSNYNIKAVAYMLDTNIWNVFAGEQAEYAIGGPSIEMLLKSYNQKYCVDYQAKSDELGYRISNDGGLTWDASNIFMLNRNDSLYVASHMYLASPSCYSNKYIMDLGDNGTVGFTGIDSINIGFRPIVCLKSSVYLEKQENDTYIIK